MSDTKEVSLAPCPFCGSNCACVSAHTDGRACTYYARCEVCSSEGPSMPSETNAIAAWNHRQPDKDLVDALLLTEQVKYMEHVAGEPDDCPKCKAEKTIKQYLAKHKK